MGSPFVFYWTVGDFYSVSDDLPEQIIGIDLMPSYNHTPPMSTRVIQISLYDIVAYLKHNLSYGI